MIRTASDPSGRFGLFLVSLGAGFLLTTGLAARAQPAGYQNLSVVKPVMTCEQLEQADVKTPDGGRIPVRSIPSRTSRSTRAPAIRMMRPTTWRIRAR